MDIQVTSASIDEKSILRNLFELYIYDYSEYMGWDLDQHGLFGYRYLDHYWTEPNRYPFLVRADDNLAGFALVSVVDDRTHMSEFFILRKYRRQGVGEAVARNLFARFPGPWHVDELAQNEAAQRFWRTVIDRATGGDYLEHTSPDSRKVIQEFAIRPGDDS
jgi:predicted acetyltransferase